MQKESYIHWLKCFIDHSYSDSTEMVKIIVHTVQSQDRVLKELFGHLSKLLGCKQKIIDLLPKVEVALSDIKEADNTVMFMQGKRQKEIWHLLKIACTQSSARSLVGSSLEGTVTPQASAWLPPTSAQREHPLSCVGHFCTNDRRKFELSWPFKHYYPWSKWGTGQ